MQTFLIIAFLIAAVNAQSSSGGRGNATDILEAAQTWQGTPYLWGGEGDPTNKGPSGPGIDCSHLVWRAVQESVNPSFPYLDTSSWQSSGAPGFSEVDCGAVHDGDMVLFQGHIGVSDWYQTVYSATSHGVRHGEWSWFGSPIMCFTFAG